MKCSLGSGVETTAMDRSGLETTALKVGKLEGDCSIIIYSRELTRNRVEWNPQRLFSSTNQWFLGSMLVFSGVLDSPPELMKVKQT